jgi:hypothetical protein
MAFITGTGLALLSRLRSARTSSPLSDERGLQIVLERLDHLEDRMSGLEARATNETNPRAGTRIEQRDGDDGDIEVPRTQLDETVSLVERRLAETVQEIPVLVESALAPHVEEMLRLEAETREMLSTVLKTLDQAIDNRISTRISTRMSVVEKALIAHSEALAALRRSEDESGALIRQLASAIDRMDQRHFDARPVVSQN